eukprot:m.130797 g.130797  ORF g.130797 m.130797 type:complete len:104 (-) comp14608_c0_seq9:584-895(-)
MSCNVSKAAFDYIHKMYVTQPNYKRLPTNFVMGPLQAVVCFHFIRQRLLLHNKLVDLTLLLLFNTLDRLLREMANACTSTLWEEDNQAFCLLGTWRASPIMVG